MVQKDFWFSVLKRLKPTIKKAHFITWFQNTLISHKGEKTVKIAVPTTYARDWISNKYGIKVLQAVKELDSKIEVIEYEVFSRLLDKGNNEGVDIKSLFVDDEKKVRKVRNLQEIKVKRGPNGHVSSQMLNGRYGLNNFVVGQENRLPHAACTAVSNTPGGIYNPLYIYGGVGFGKTHLLQAIGNEILSLYPDMVVKYMTAERFVTEVVDAIGKRYMNKFKEQYRKVDCFLLDDVQFFARKNSSQQEFFHTFNELYDGNKQIVITSDRPPSELDDLDERLKSRFSMGMVVELLNPDYETRLAILNQKCQEFEVIIDPKVLEFVASNVTTNVRNLEGVLRQIVAEGQLGDRVPTIRTAAEVIRRLNKAHKIIGFDIESKKDAYKKAQTAKDVINVVAEYFSLSEELLKGTDRHKEIATARQVCMYLIKNELNQSYEKIGEAFSGRNHTTVLHACKRTAERLKKDLKLVRDINSIKQEMGL